MKILTFVVLLALGAVSADAAAQSRLIATEARSPFADSEQQIIVAGPRFVGDELVWAEHRRATDEVAIAADGPGGRRTIDRIPRLRAQIFAMDAADGRAALASHIVTCDGEESCSKYMGASPRDLRLRVGPLSGPLTDVPLPCYAVEPIVVADAYGARCFGPEFHVRDDDGTSRRPRVGAARTRDVQMAGRFLASRVTEGVERTTLGIKVEDRRSGEEVYRVDAPARGFDLAPDGAIAFALHDRRIGLASPSARAMRTIEAPFVADDVRLAGDRVAARTTYSPQFAVLDTSGRLLGAHAGPAPYLDWDFDGRRVAWMQRPCSRVTLAVWEAESAPPPSAGDRCGAATVREGRVVATRARGLAIPLSCPATEPAGCAGTVTVTMSGARPGGRRARRTFAYEYFDLDPGASMTALSRLFAADIRRFRSLRRVRLDISVEPARAAAGATTVRRGVKLPR